MSSVDDFRAPGTRPVSVPSRPETAWRGLARAGSRWLFARVLRTFRSALRLPSDAIEVQLSVLADATIVALACTVDSREDEAGVTRIGLRLDDDADDQREILARAVGSLAAASVSGAGS